jgi:glycosyltransferase involved in cell wall biosynthesis
LKLLYLLSYPELNGGNKVVFQHAELLRRLGHEVTLAAEGARPTWIPFGGTYLDRSELARATDRYDLVIATFWTTVRQALDLDLGPVAHFCQGYEGALEHLAPRLPEIEAVYREPLPTLVVSPYLVPFLAERFGRRAAIAPPPLDPRFTPAARPGPSGLPWIAVPGIFAAPVKGVPTALAAIARLRERGLPVRLLRFSILPLDAEERKQLEPDRYLSSVPPEVIAEEIRAADLLLLPSREGEGFGLPLLEAMASGTPAVASSIPSIRGFATGAAALVPPGDSDAMADATERLLLDRKAWLRARRAGLAAASRFRPEEVAAIVEGAVAWAARTAARR